MVDACKWQRISRRATGREDIIYSKPVREGNLKKVEDLERWALGITQNH